MSDIKPKAYIQPLAVRPRVSRPQPNGLPIINLSFNELPYPPSLSVLDAIQSATVQANRYGNPSCDALRAAIGTYYQLNPDRIVCGNGSEELLDIIGRCYAGVGDEIVISEYGYIQFPIVANRVGAKLVKAPEHHLRTHIDNVLEAITNKTRIVFIANPNNPTGTMVSVSELRRLAEQLSPQVVLVLDLAYGEFVSETYIHDVHSLAREFQNVITTQTFSKAFGLAGLRVGWCYAPEWMIPTLYAARGMGTVNAAAQAGALAALENIDTVSDQISAIKAERARLTGLLSSIGFEVTPSSANFLLMAVHQCDTGAADLLTRHLFDHAGIVVNQTREAGLERYIRFSLSLPEHNNVLLNSIEAFAEVA